MRTQQMTGAIVLALGLAFGLSFGSGAQAQSEKPEISPEQRAEFNKKVQERNRLYLKLQQLDERAAKAMKEGKKPTDLHAEQVSVQDQLDLKRLRVQILATRYGLNIPPLPEESARDGGSGGKGATSKKTEEQIQQAFARGRNRALDRVKSDYKRFVSSLNFEGFIQGAD